LLTDRKREAILSRGSITGVSISCDSAVPATFETLRAGASFERWRTRVGRFLSEAQRANRYRSRPLRISMFTVLSKPALEGVDETIRLASDLGFRSMVLFEPIQVDEAAAALCPATRELSTLDFDRLENLGRRLGVDIDVCARREATPPAASVRCLQPWDYVFVRAGGNVAPCRSLVDAGEALVMGNLLEQSFAEIWHGQRFRQFRRTSALGTNPLCQHCPYY
jgi:radical SAM protein with 4Fe4S-binding SPASM domain